MTGRRGRLRGIVVPLLAVLASTVCACAGPIPVDGMREVPLPPPQVIRGHDPEVTTERGPVPPESGVWLGAWVRPDEYGPGSRAAAFEDFRDRVGAQLRIAHNFREWGDDFPGAHESEMLERADLLMISWAGTDSRSVITGAYDALIRQRAEAVRELGVPILLRFRWEMDRPNLSAVVRSPEDYVAAWRHVRALFTEAGATNAAWVWCPHALGFTEADRNAPAYYPGDEHVDWLCADVYSEPDFRSFPDQMDPVLAFAQEHDKPVVVGEFGVTSGRPAAERATWLAEVQDYVRAHPQIKALVYFSAEGQRPPYFDTTLDDDPEALSAFRQLAADPYFQAPVATE